MSTVDTDSQWLELFASDHQFLCERLRLLVSDIHLPLRQDIIRALQEPGKLLAPLKNSKLPSGRWALLTFLLARYISPETDLYQAANVALAIECFICALDLLDDVEDEDQTAILKELGFPRVLNVSTALIGLSHKAILLLSEMGVPAERVLQLCAVIQQATLVATSGQHQDLLAESESVQSLTMEDCIEIATKKAGALLRLACRLSVLFAEADEELCEKFSSLGELLGITAQLDNDSHDLHALASQNSASHDSSPGSATSITKTDLVRRKKTLPLILAAQANPALSDILYSTEKQDQAQSLQALNEGIIAAWGIALLYRVRFEECLKTIEERKPLSPSLRLLLGYI